MAKKLTQEKAKEILRHGEVRGKPLTPAQKGFFGARAGGVPVKKKDNPGHSSNTMRFEKNKNYS